MTYAAALTVTALVAGQETGQIGGHGTNRAHGRRIVHMGRADGTHEGHGLVRFGAVGLPGPGMPVSAGYHRGVGQLRGPGLGADGHADSVAFT